MPKREAYWINPRTRHAQHEVHTWDLLGLFGIDGNDARMGVGASHHRDQSTLMIWLSQTTWVAMPMATAPHVGHVSGASHHAVAEVGQR